MYRLLTEPPNFIIQDYANQVENPYEGCTEEKHDGKHDCQRVICFNATKKSVNGPYDVEYGDAENEFDDPRKVV